eukprot:CAMPEP_0173217624 /NCGR_PEP_ID=MMETSP1142-20121109/599_1 /TAXON_ID=483371 /ORGANISM="non described non described, Strain CCMP2298" /LENGTH=198 /DNA_ID=CAMNT_0014145225 /DNA_START=134 /DNA_END=727 /DNA_ORIENTATION=-
MAEAIFEAAYCEGTLKQQCLDGNGLYVWERKRFTLDIPSQNLYVRLGTETETEQTVVSLRGSKYAKEWSFSSSLAGFGFDLVWASGKIWSFLVDDEPTCKSWVLSINRSVSQVSEGEENAERKSDSAPLRHSNVRPPKAPLDGGYRYGTVNSSYDSVETNETKVEVSSPPHQHQQQEPGTAEKFGSSQSRAATPVTHT